MFKIEEEDNSIKFTISSEMKLTDRLVKEAREFVSQFDITGFSCIKIVLRELLINAIEHGNKSINTKNVKCEIEKLPSKRYRVVVEDEGKGFDYKNTNMSIPEDPSKLRKRGLPLVNTMSDGLEFNEAGNIVTSYITVETETDFELDEEGTWKIITPTGNITAATSDRLREMLHELVDSGTENFRFDLKKVSDIDSVGLSTMIVLSRTLEKKGGNFSLETANPSPDIVKLFEMTHMDNLYKIVYG